MRKRLLELFLVLSILLSCSSCVTTDQSDSYFRITFLDVGQGDCALVECDGHYMLIDGGDTTAEDKVYNVLVEKGIQELDILAISHLHKDHYGGLTKALTYAQSVGITISNSDYPENNKDTFRKFENQLCSINSEITIPPEGKEYQLGSAVVEVIDVSAKENNDSLVLQITYGKTRFLFTGDIGKNAQRRITEKIKSKSGNHYYNLIKIPHHGAKEDEYNTADQRGSVLYDFINTILPKKRKMIAIISVGKNSYGHPDQATLDLLEQAGAEVYRTDKNGDITVTSNGKRLSSPKCSK